MKPALESDLDGRMAVRWVEPLPRRQLDVDQVEGLIKDWELARQEGENPGPLCGHLGWTQAELDHYRATGQCPRGG